MTFDTTFWVAITMGVAFLFGVGLGYNIRKDKVADGSTQTGSPQIVVNVPADYVPIKSLPITEIEGAKAALWWTCYERTLEAAVGDTGYARDFDIENAVSAANDAVDKVFGS